MDETDGVREIPLPCGKIALVSECDYRRVSQLSWSDRKKGYVRARNKRSAGGDGGFVYLHRYILGAPEGYVVDHIDRNPLNNTRENLQIVTRSRNCMRAHSKKSCVSKDGNQWRAKISVDGQLIYLGRFATKSAAEKAVAEARAKAWNDEAVNRLGVLR